VLLSWLPNIVDPVTYSVLEVIICTLSVWAVIVFVTVNEPVIVWLPLNLFEPVVANEPLSIVALRAYEAVKA
jgi:hypothetical protein